MSTPYQPPLASRTILGNDILWLLSCDRTQTVADVLTGKTYMCVLPGGQLYFESKLDLDTDGSAFAAQDPSGQPSTSAKDVHGHDLDADAINYFVLPGKGYAKHGIALGDVAVVIFGQRMAFACFGDVGPSSKLGEGSIALHRALGHETIHHGQLTNAGISRGVITIVFPHSGIGRGLSTRESAIVGGMMLQELRSSRILYEGIQKNERMEQTEHWSNLA